MFTNDDGAKILDAARANIARFVTLPSQAALDIVTLWAAHTHVVDQFERLMFDTTPRLAIISDEPASGKTAVLEQVMQLSLNGRMMIGCTPTSFCMAIDEKRQTIGLDEIDKLFGRNGAAKQDLQAIINGGYKRGNYFTRANKAEIHTFAPLAVAGLGAKFRTVEHLAPLKSRSIVIEQRPVVRTEDDESYRHREHGAVVERVRRDLAGWCRKNARLIMSLYAQDIPKGIDNRLKEVCEPLFMVADAAGGHWPESIRTAAREILLGEVSDDNAELSLTDQLLVSLKQVFADREKLPTTEITDALYRDPAWRKLWPNPNTAPRELAALLSPLGIQPSPVRIGESVLRGYHRWELQELWASLPGEELPDAQDVAAVTPVAAAL